MDATPPEFDYLTRRRSFAALGRLAGRVYGGSPRSTVVDESMWRAFPRGYVGAWMDDVLVGSIQLWPLDARRATGFLVGERSERELTEDDLAAVCNADAAVWYFSGLLVDPGWRDRGLAAHLLAEALVRWHRDLPWRMPVSFVALATTPEGLRFIREFGMREARPAAEMADGHSLWGRRFDAVADLTAVVVAARTAADRKGRPLAAG